MSLAGGAAHVRAESGLWQDSWFLVFTQIRLLVGYLFWLVSEPFLIVLNVMKVSPQTIWPLWSVRQQSRLGFFSLSAGAHFSFLPILRLSKRQPCVSLVCKHYLISLVFIQ